jgi:pimeloyl-ACP methyl ester carboxylesterase
MTYVPLRASSSRFIAARGLRHHLRCWAGEGEPLVMLHGWMDVSASFQFMVDAFVRPRNAVALDLRGFGLTGPVEATRADCYWFPDYLADLDAVLDALVGDRQVTLVGHSMGGNIAMLYAGVRPQRVRAVVNLEGFGLRDNAPESAPRRYAQWLDELRAPPPLRGYRSLAEVAARLRKTNPRLTDARAGFLAQHWSLPAEAPEGAGSTDADGAADGAAHFPLRLAADPAHRIVNPVLYRWAEVAACWRAIEAPVLWVEGAQTDAHRWAGDAEETAQRIALLQQVQREVIDDAGHMLHHDQPLAVARSIERFVDALPA